MKLLGYVRYIRNISRSTTNMLCSVTVNLERFTAFAVSNVHLRQKQQWSTKHHISVPCDLWLVPTLPKWKSNHYKTSYPINAHSSFMLL